MFEQSRGVKRVREQDNDPMLDRHGNAATPKLFVNKLPHNIKEEEVSDLFSKYDGFVSVQLGNKLLLPGEFRTGVVTFVTAEQAAAGRVALQHHQAPGWTNPMLINFVKQDSRDPQPHFSNSLDDSSLERDSLGNFACATLFIKNFNPELSTEHMSVLFPTATKIIPGNKQLRVGEFRTAYVTFEDTTAAIAARKSKSGYLDEMQVVPLVIYYSVRPQDQTKPTGGIQKGPSPSSNNYPSVPYPLHPASILSPVSSIPPISSPIHSSPMHASAFSPYSAINPYALYSSYPPSPSYADPYSPLPYQPRMASVPSEEARYSLSDLFDAKGNAANNSLFIDCLPYDIRENQIHAIFARCVGFKGLHMGNKALSPSEYRTAVIHFTSTENALKARAKLQNYREAGWARPLIIHYAKHN